MKRFYLSIFSLLLSFLCLAQWQQVNNGITNLATGARLIGTSNTHLFAVSFADGVYKTSDNGQNWTPVTTPVGFTSPPKCGFFYDGKYFVGLDNSTNCISYTSDNGDNWTSGSGSPASTVVRGFASTIGNLFAYTSTKGVFKSSDGGVTWIEANTGLSNLKIASMTSTNVKLIVATEGAGVFISSDNGATWVQSNSGITGSLTGTLVFSYGSNLYYYTMVGNQLYLSSNDGSFWVSGAKPDFLQSSVVGQTKTIKEVYRKGSNFYMMARTQYGISITDSVFITDDEGMTWKNITENLPSDVLGSGITEMGSNVFIAYGSANTGIYRRSASSTGLKESLKDNLISIFPNPFSGQIELRNSSKENVSQVSIYDSKGRLVLSEKGRVEVIYTSNFDKGIYFIEIEFLDGSKMYKKVLCSGL